MWYIIGIVSAIDVALIILFVMLSYFKVKQIKLNRMLNLYKVKRNLPVKKASNNSSWNKKLALTCSLFLVVNITGVISIQPSIGMFDAVGKSNGASSNDASFVATSESKHEGIEPGESNNDSDSEDSSNKDEIISSVK